MKEGVIMQNFFSDLFSSIATPRATCTNGSTMLGCDWCESNCTNGCSSVCSDNCSESENNAGACTTCSSGCSSTCGAGCALCSNLLESILK